MKKQIKILLFLLLFPAIILSSQTEYNFRKWAPTPPMGWNSWDCFDAGATETQVIQNAEYMRDNLKEFGWEYVVLDIRWYVKEIANYYIEPATYSIDEWGRYVPPANRFPSGMKGMADQIHDMGLKFGIHIMRGLPKEAAQRKLPVKGANGITCDMISSTDSTCTWLQDNHKVLSNEYGQLYYNSIFDMYAEWGIDFVKVDDISRPFHEGEINMIRKAIDQCGRPIVLSLSPGATNLSYGETVSKYANMWRMTDDLWDRWSDVYAIFERARSWNQYRLDGCYPDADMIPFGAINYSSNFVDHRKSNLTYHEQETLMNLWGVIKSPLMYGGHMPANTEKELTLMTNKSLIEMNQYGVKPREVYASNGEVMWTSINPATGEHYVCLFNIKGGGNQKYSTDNALYSTQVIAYTLPYEDVSVEISENTNMLTLLCDDAGDGFSFDHGNWLNAKYILDDGSEIYIDQSHVATFNASGSYYNYININKSISGNPLSLNNTTYDKGIGTHSNTLIYLTVPTFENNKVVKFEARCAMDDNVANNQTTSMRFMVFDFNPAVNERIDDVLAIANSGLISRKINFNEGKELSANIENFDKIHLAVSDFGDGFAYDRSNWINPVLIADDGTSISLVDLEPDYYYSDWGSLRKNKNVENSTLNIGGETYTTGLGMNSNAVAEYSIPKDKNYIRFESLVGLDYSVLTDAPSNNNSASTVEFLVFGDKIKQESISEITLPLTELGFEENQQCIVTDLWQNSEVGVFNNDNFKASLAKHQSAFYKVESLVRANTNNVTISANDIEKNSAIISVSISGEYDENSYIQVIDNDKIIGSYPINNSLDFALSEMTGTHTIYVKYSGTNNTNNAESNKIVLNFDEIVNSIINSKVNNKMMVNVYSISGQLLKSNVLRSDAISGLPRGIYIIDNQKEIVF